MLALNQPAKRYEYISILDPSIKDDVSEEDKKKYQSTLDINLLRTDGKETVFTLRPSTFTERNEVIRILNDNTNNSSEEKNLEASIYMIRNQLVGIRNGGGIPDFDSDKIDQVEYKHFNNIEVLPLHLIMEIGGILFNISGFFFQNGVSLDLSSGKLCSTENQSNNSIAQNA
jgi:hypothetical protein